MATLQNWEVTSVKSGQSVEAHKHNFNAVYYTNGIKELYSNGKKTTLPDNAVVYIPQGAEHAWSGVQENREIAEVGHFHSGHGVHSIVPEYQ